MCQMCKINFPKLYSIVSVNLKHLKYNSQLMKTEQLQLQKVVEENDNLKDFLSVKNTTQGGRITGLTCDCPKLLRFFCKYSPMKAVVWVKAFGTLDLKNI